MSASEKTKNYNLPIYKDADSLNVLNDFNNAMREIDKNIKLVALSAENADSKTNNNTANIEIVSNTATNALKNANTALNSLDYWSGEIQNNKSNIATVSETSANALNNANSALNSISKIENIIPTSRTPFFTSEISQFSITNGDVRTVSYFEEILDYGDYTKTTITTSLNFTTTATSNTFMLSMPTHFTGKVKPVNVTLSTTTGGIYITNATTHYQTGNIIIKTIDSIDISTSLDLTLSMIVFKTT